MIFHGYIKILSLKEKMGVGYLIVQKKEMIHPLGMIFREGPMEMIAGMDPVEN